MTSPTPVQPALERALAAHRAGRLDEAVTLYESVLAAQPNNADALHLLGLALHQAGRSNDGIPLIEQAIRLQPTTADFHANLAGIFAARGRLADAVDSMRRAAERRPGDEALQRRLVLYLRQLGVQLIEQDRPADATRILEEAVKVRPDSADAAGNLGLALSRLRRNEEAVARLQQAIALKPDVAELHTNLGAGLLALGRVRESIAAHRRACALRSGWHPAMSNLAIALAQLGGTDEALALHEAVLRDKPDDATALFNRGVIRLSRGDFLSGWRDYEARFHVAELKGQRTFAEPQWIGDTDVAGKAILVHAEQGLGDTIQFVRYVPLLRARGARVIVQCDALLVRLFRHSLPGVEVLAREDALPPFNVHVPVMSLPFAFRTTLETIPADVPYLAPLAELCEAWSKRIGPGGTGVLRVGVVWSGNPGHYNDRNRSIPLDSLLPAFANLPGLRLFSLQKGPGVEQLARVDHHRTITDLAPHLHDLADTVAAMLNLDLVIAVDTSVAHLAGAIGVRVWTLLPDPADFRWMTGRTDSPWYPTMRLFRQDAGRGWQSVVEAIGAELGPLARVGNP